MAPTNPQLLPSPSDPAADSPRASFAPELPDSFFADLDPTAGSAPSAFPSTTPSAGRDMIAALPSARPGTTTWAPTQKFMFWYDSIIDDMLANPGTNMTQTARRLGKSPVTIGLICRSDLFKARYEQRRASFNRDIQLRLTNKLAQVAEAALDHTLTALDKKKDAVPLPLLNEIANRALDRLGYEPRSQAPANPSVVIQNHVGAQSSVAISQDDLRDARERLRIVEDRNATASTEKAEGTPSEGSSLGVVIDGSSGRVAAGGSEELVAPARGKGGDLDAL